MPGRRYSSGSAYRYGFNGKENDNDIKGEGNEQDYGMRIYDPRLGKFLSNDPLKEQFPWWTPYQFAGNTPTNTIDLDGMEVPSGKNKNKTEVTREAIQKALGAVDFSDAKLERGKYKTMNEVIMGDPFANISTFGMNSTKAAWNQIVDAAEVGVNLTTQGGRMKLWSESVMPMAKFIFFDWEMMGPEQKLNFLKTVATDPETYENLVATLALCVVTEKFVPSLKMPVPKELEPLKKEIKSIINSEKAAAKTGVNLATRPDIVIKGGRSGQLLKNATGPANSVVKGAAEGRVLVTNQKGQVIWDITKERAKSVIPGQGFGPKVTPTKDQLNLIKQIWGN